jgi:hypothetical protein
MLHWYWDVTQPRTYGVDEERAVPGIILRRALAVRLVRDYLNKTTEPRQHKSGIYHRHLNRNGSHVTQHHAPAHRRSVRQAGKCVVAKTSGEEDTVGRTAGRSRSASLRVRCAKTGMMIRGSFVLWNPVLAAARSAAEGAASDVTSRSIWITRTAASLAWRDTIDAHTS